MRKLKLQMQVSIDGFASTGPNDDQQWVTWALDEIYQSVLDMLDSMDTIILGRKLAVDYIPYWEEVLNKPHDPMYEFAKRIVKAKKIIFSQTLDKSSWNNTDVTHENLVEKITALKKEAGKDIVVYGGTSFVASLIKEGLIDEIFLYVNPVALGTGVSVFSSLKKYQQLKLKESTVFKSGIVLLHFEYP